MTDRVQAYLDGEIARNELSDGERVRVVELETTTTAVAAALRAVPAPDLTSAVMRGLPAAPPDRYEFPSATADPFAWLTKPRSLTLTARPAFLFAAAAAIAAFALFRSEPDASLARGVMAYAAPDAPMIVQFRLEVDNASKVQLEGSFTQWEPLYDLAEVAPGQWSVLVPLAPGVHDYVFIVDGERRVADPYQRRAEDGNGLPVSRLFLTRPKSVESPTRLAAHTQRRGPNTPGASAPALGEAK
jgi:hypothetical protein